MDMEYVVDFVQMKRFDDPLLVEVLEAMRTPGGKKISEKAWEAITATEITEKKAVMATTETMTRTETMMTTEIMTSTETMMTTGTMTLMTKMAMTKTRKL